MQEAEQCEENSVVEDSQNEQTKYVKHKLKNEEFDIEVYIHNMDFARKYKDTIETFLKDLLGNDASYAVHCKTEEEVEEGEIGTDRDMFCIDKISSSVAFAHGHQTPIYNSPFRPIFQSSSDGKKRDSGTQGGDDRKKKSKGPAMTCFNCLGSHHLAACPQERNMHRIRENRKNFLEEKNPSRYYEGKSNTFDESKFRPGIISEKLRDAMNLKPNELPFYIYRMRLLGYPPGWLTTAEVESSGISLISADGKVDGDILSPEMEKKYDSRKFIEYPGFNCPVPDGVVDEWKRFQMPPMQRHQQLSEVWKHDLVFTPTPPQKSQQQPPDKAENDPTVTPDPKEAISNHVDDKSAEDSAQEKEKEGSSRSMSLGAMVVDTGNPCKELPSAEKFATGITDHINYENLPDGSGTYDKLRGVLEKARVIKSKTEE